MRTATLFPFGTAGSIRSNRSTGKSCRFSGDKTPVEQKSVAGKSVISELDTPAGISFDGNGIPTNYTKSNYRPWVAYTAQQAPVPQQVER